MSGSRLGRGRGGRLAVYGACGVVVVLLVFLYRAATTEMSRLRELHVQCSHQHDALEAQLQVIYEYKMRLEKSLAEEKSSNAAVKQELQQRASREKTLRDKDSVEAMQRFNSLQQNHKQLQAEHQDLKEECEKQHKQALEDTKKLESTLRDLRTQLRDAAEDKTKSMEHLKTVHLELKIEKDKLEEKYNALLKSNGNTDSTIEHLRKEVIQLNRELKDSQSSCKATSPGPSVISERSQQQLAQPNAASEGGGSQVAAAVPADEQQGNRPSPQQQVSRPSNDVSEIPHPIQAPRDHQPIRNNPGDDNNKPADDEAAISDVGFVRRGGNIVPAGPEDLDNAPRDSDKASLPLPYVVRPNAKDDDDEQQQQRRKPGKDGDRVESVGDAPPKPRSSTTTTRKTEPSGPRDAKSTASKEPRDPLAPMQKSAGVENSQMRPGDGRREENLPVPSGVDEIQELENRVAGLLK